MEKEVGVSKLVREGSYIYRTIAIDMEQFFNEIRLGNKNAVSTMLAKEPGLVNARDQRGSTPLILAAYYNHSSIVSELLDYNAPIDEKDAAGNTALMGVCFKGFGDIAKQLIDAGADVNATNAMGGSCLIFAITFKHVGIAKLLIEHGADTKAKDARGNTALDHARMQEVKPLIELLENH
ncbi:MULTISPECIES: ankyrin repeat domain-containing protein [Zeaxanthinibacter]|uniref:ankyrin repeat domain-containing protein n=1 Tax=Zeaxanthinibacter TaxID=561554 RepID=UPI00300DF1C3